jgi:hypothetical protein
MELLTLGFLGMYRFLDDMGGAATRGAMLVTDVKTKPLEFRVTASVRPQKFQEMLYGELLEEHMAVELIGLPLLNALQQKPSLIIVRDVLFLGLNPSQEIPTIRLIGEDEPLLIRGASTKSLNSLDSGNPPIKIHTSGQFEEKLDEIGQQLQSISLARNLMEPFDRLEKACTDVHARKVGDS